MVAGSRGIVGMSKKGEGIQRYKLVVAEYSRGYKVQHREGI